MEQNESQQSQLSRPTAAQPTGGAQPEPELGPQLAGEPQQPQPGGSQPQPYPQPYPQPHPQPLYPLQSPQSPQRPLPPLPPLGDTATLYKKRLRSTVMKIVLALVAFYVVNIFVSIIVGFGYLIVSGTMGDIISAALQSGPNALTEESLMNMFPVGLMSIAGIAAGSLALLMVRGKRLFTEDLTRVNERIHLSSLVKLMALILGFNAIISFLPVLLDLLLQSAGLSLPGDLQPPIDSLLNPMGLLYVVLVGPLFEEIIFRGAILRALQPQGDNFAIVVSSILFGVYHLVLFQGVFAFFVGLVLAYCALRFSLKWSLLLHIANNGLAMAITLFVPNLPLEMGIYLLFLAVGLAAGATGLEAFRQQLRNGKPSSMSVALSGAAPAGAAPAAGAGAPVSASAPVAGAGAAPAGAGAAPAIAFGEQAPQPLPRPFALAFTSPWLIAALSLCLVISLMPFA
jgi:membrane protease YdiL (CAAX protease family)